MISVGGFSVTSTFGNDLALRKQGNNILVNNHRIEKADSLAYNGLVHILDGVLLTADELHDEDTVSERLVGGPNAMSKSARDATSGSSHCFFTWHVVHGLAVMPVLFSQLLV